MDMSDECNEDGASQYLQVIRVLCWAMELGRIDIYTEVAMLMQQLVVPWVGHLKVVYHVLAYLDKHNKSRIIFDPTDPIPVTPTMSKPDWALFYSDATEELPPKNPETQFISTHLWMATTEYS